MGGEWVTLNRQEKNAMTYFVACRSLGGNIDAGQVLQTYTQMESTNIRKNAWK
jgi:hypothetical protein